MQKKERLEQCNLKQTQFSRSQNISAVLAKAMNLTANIASRVGYVVSVYNTCMCYAAE